jgi:hypothetical protein
MFEKLWIVVLCNQPKYMIICNVEEPEVVQMFHCFAAKYKLPTVCNLVSGGEGIVTDMYSSLEGQIER